VAVKRAEALRLADAHLAAEGSPWVASGANRYRGVWLVGYVDPAHPDEMLQGGGLIVLPDGEVLDFSSAPRALDELLPDPRRAHDTDDEALELMDASDPAEAAELRALRQSRQRARGEIA